MEVVSNICLCILWFLVDTVTVGSKNVTVNPDLTILNNDHVRPGECRLSNSTILNANAIIAFNSTKQAGGGRLLVSLMSGSGRLLPETNESDCGRLEGGRLSIEWNWEQQQTGTEAGEQCHINTQLDLKWTNGTEVDGGLGWIVMDATLLLEISSLAHTQGEIALPPRAKVLANGRRSTLQVYKCTSIRQVAAEFEDVDSRQVATKIVCGSIDWRQIQVQLRIENRTEDNFFSGPIPWSNYEMTCDLTKTQTTDAAENDRKMEPLSQPNPSTIYVATAFGVLVLCIVVVYFVVKNRRQGASYATMSDD